MWKNMVLRCMDDMYDMKKARDKKLSEIRTEWLKTYTMPRKMKKQRRKELQLDYSIYSYDPFGIWD